jgi:hypothetical protein
MAPKPLTFAFGVVLAMAVTHDHDVGGPTES